MRQRSNMGASGLDRLEFAALAYLFLPLFVFVFGWLRWSVALLLAAAMAWPLIHLGRRAMPTGGRSLGVGRWLFLALLAGAWAAASGLLGPFRMNDDWHVRLAVLHDLIVGAWPVSYGQVDGGELLLRFPMDYFLVPALFGKWAGLAAARLALWAWTALGTMLFFALVVQAPAPQLAAAGPAGRVSWRRMVGVTALLVLFGGMDLIGWVQQMLTWPEAGQRIEWWAWWFQYSSQTTLMFWVPNHALPAWLCTAMIWRHRDSGLEVAAAAVALLACVAWAPLVAVGIAPLLLLVALREQQQLKKCRAALSLAWLLPWLRLALRPVVVATMPPALLFSAFVTFGIPAGGGTQLPQLKPADLYSLMFLFAVLEWATLALLLWRASRQSWLFWFAAAELLALPLLHFGPSNDLVMRGGIPGMTILILATLTTLTSGTTSPRFKIAICAVLLVGTAVPVQEFIRAGQPHGAWQDQEPSLAEQSLQGWNYVGVLRDGPLRQVLRPPHALENTPKVPEEALKRNGL